MAIINCQDCGRVCAGSPSGQCPACYLETSQAEVKVAKYLEFHQNSTLEEIHQATSVDRHIIMRMIRKGCVSEGAVSYPCENCRTPIIKGRLCADCAGHVLKVLEPRGMTPRLERLHSGMHTRQFIFTNG